MKHVMENLARLAESANDQRRTKRTSTIGAASLLWIDGDGRLRLIDVALRDLSETGIGVRFFDYEEPVPIGQLVLVAYPNGSGSWGRIRLCDLKDGCYVVGVEQTGAEHS